MRCAEKVRTAAVVAWTLVMLVASCFAKENRR
jgi:hypothetical protein